MDASSSTATRWSSSPAASTPGSCASGGFRLEDPDGSATLAIPVATHPAELELGPDDLVILATKSQDTQAALDALDTAAGAPGAVACAQNGVDNERMARRHHARVLAMWCM